MNVYDFDKTIYPRDSEFEFYRELMVRYPTLFLSLPAQCEAGLRFLLGKISKTECKARFYAALSRIPDIDREVSAFWDRHEKDIEPYYLLLHRPDDVVISASPAFLLEEIIRRLDIGTLIASPVDKKTGAYAGENCYGEEKCRRYRAVFGDTPVDDFFSDSLSDTPMARMAERAFLIKGHHPIPWPWEKCGG